MPIGIDEAIQILNRLSSKDQEAIRALIAIRVPCNESLANDETCQVRAYDPATGQSSPRYAVGTLGVINAFFSNPEQTVFIGYDNSKDPGFFRFEIPKQGGEKP
jgi:hypothetical protein